jgi:hypothetical protein
VEDGVQACRESGNPDGRDSLREQHHEVVAPAAVHETHLAHVSFVRTRVDEVGERQLIDGRRARIGETLLVDDGSRSTEHWSRPTN